MKFNPQSIGLKTWDTFFALDSFDTYRREIEGMIEREADLATKLHGPKWVPITEEDHDMWEWERREAKRMHEEVLSPMFRYSLVVSLFSLYETELVRVVGILEKDSPQRPVKRCDLAGDVIPQCMRYLQIFENVPNPKGWKEAAEINELRLVRNCIVHCNGQVSQFGERQKLLAIWGGGGSYEKDGILCVEQTRIDINGKFLLSRFGAIWRFYKKLFESLSWPVAADWTAKNT